METWIVTGGAGFIGCNFARLALAKSAARIVVADKLTYAGSLLNLADVESDPRFAFVKADIADRDAVTALYREHRPAAVVNFAAETHVDRSIDGPADFVQTNLVGTFELLEAARGYTAELPPSLRERFRFLHVSTDEVFGSLGPDGAFHESTPYDPSSPYSASKAGADHLVGAYHRTYGLPVLLTNCSNNYGPYQFPEKLVPLMILNAIEGKPLPVYGDGGNVRDWLYVEDHCAGLLRALERGVPGERYNLGGFGERSNLEIVEALCAQLERILPPAENTALARAGVSRYVDLVRFVADRPGHDRRYAIDSSKAQRALGWRPDHDLEQGLAATVQWYLDHRDWCEALAAGSYQRERLGLGGR